MENADESVCTCVCLGASLNSTPPFTPRHCVRWCCRDISVTTRTLKCTSCASVRVFMWCILSKEAVLLVFTVSLGLQRPFNLKTSQFESPSNIWLVFLLWLNDWMHPRRFLLTSSPIWNLVPVRGAATACAHTTHTRLRLQKPLSVSYEQRRDLGMISV